MKKVFIFSIFIVAILLNVNFALAEEPKNLDGFLGIKWGATQKQVKKIMSKRDNTTRSDNKYLSYYSTFVGEKSEIIYRFYNNSLYQANAYLNDISESKILDKWEDIKRQITNKYGQPEKDIYEFKSPYYDGDGYETSAIRQEKCTAEAWWYFPATSGKEDNWLCCEINKDLNIVITYASGELTKEFFAAEEIKNVEDL